MRSIAIKLIVGAALICGAFAASTRAEAMPAPGASTLVGATDAVAQARWVCGPNGCWWRPNTGYVRPWGGYGYRRWGAYRPRGYGWRGGWHGGWHGRGWHGRGWHGRGWHGGWHGRGWHGRGRRW